MMMADLAMRLGFRNNDQKPSRARSLALLWIIRRQLTWPVLGNNSSATTGSNQLSQGGEQVEK